MEDNRSYLQNKVSFFNNCRTNEPDESFSIEEILFLVQGGLNADAALQYRDLVKKDPARAKSFKSSSMAAVTCAGTFKNRNKDGLISPSGIIVLDIDDVPEKQFATLKASLSKDKYTLAIMNSPGGCGLKVFVRMHFGYGEETYKCRYNEVMNYFAATYSIPICDNRKNGSSSWGLDRACSDICRLCILGTDIIVNENPEVFEVFQEFSPTETRVKKLIQQICEQQVDITPSYDEWFRIACALKREFGEGSRPYFHQVSQFYPKYTEKETDLQFAGIQSKPENPITIATFFDSCKNYGISVSPALPQVVEISEPSEIAIEEVIRVPKFPVEVFPIPIRSYLLQSTKSLNCPIDYLGASTLMIISAAVGKKYSISPKSGYNETAVLFLAIIGDPGQKKSPAFKTVMIPVYKLEEEYWKQYKQEMIAYKSEYEAWKAARKDTPDMDEPVKPTLKRILTSDNTMEALGVLFEENPIGLLSFNDELLGWINGLNQYKGKGNDLQKYLSLWSGINIQIDRKGQEPRIIANPFLSVTGGIPPDVLKDLSMGRNDGFQDRILFCYPDRITPRYTRDRIDDVTASLYSKKISELFQHSTGDFEANSFESFKLMMTDEQVDVWEGWVNPHLAETEALGFPYYLKGSWVKMEAHSLRLILLLAYSRTKPAEKVEIRMEDVEGGIKLAEYFKTHIRRTYQEIHNSEIDKKILKAVEFVKRNGGSTTYRNFYKCGIAGCKGPKDTDVLFREMESRELGKRGKSAASPGAKQSDVFVLNPILF